MKGLDLVRDLGAGLSRATERWVPDSWVICMMLTVAALALAILGAGVGPVDAALAWGGGMWSLLGLAMQFTIANPTGNNTLALLLVSTERAQLVSMLGGAILTEPVLQFLLPVAAKGSAFDFAIPNDPNLVGAIAFAQVLQADAGARFQVSFSRGLEIAFGR